MTTKQSTSSEQTSTKDTLSYNSSIEGTPFRMIKNDENQYFAACGDYQITPTLPTPDEVIEYIIDEPWQLTLTLIHIVLHKNNLINHN